MANTFHRKVKCPRHFLLRPGSDPFLMEPNPLMGNVPKWAYTRWPQLRRKVYKRGKHGQKVYDRSSYYQPEKSAAFYVHHVYDPKNWICAKECKGRCLEGVENRRATIGPRLSGGA